MNFKIAEAIKQEFAEPVRQSMDRVETRLRAQHDSISRLGAEVKRLGRSDKEFVEKNGVLDKYKNAVKAFTSLEESLKAGATFYSDLRTFCLDVLMAVLLLKLLAIQCVV